jgi:hypothetical protein
MGFDVFELRVNYVDVSDRMQSVMHFLSSVENSTDPEGDATNLGTSFDTAMRTLFLAAFPVSTLYTSIQTRRVNNTGGPSYYGPAGASVQGTAIASSKVDASISALLTAPYNDAAVGGPNKWRVARLFMGAVPFNFLQDNVWSAAALTAYNAIATGLGNSFGSGTTFMSCLWSKKHLAQTGPLAWSFQPTIACLRKRAFPSR